MFRKNLVGLTTLKEEEDLRMSPITTKESKPKISGVKYGENIRKRLDPCYIYDLFTYSLTFFIE